MTQIYKSPEDVQTYSVNLMWIKKSKDNKPYIDNSDTEEALINNILNSAIKWGQANPDGKIKIWYDSKLCTNDALDNTKAVLKRALKQEYESNIEFKDINILKTVIDNPELFKEGAPIYFRVDLLKLIICHHNLACEKEDSAIFSDTLVGELRENKDRMDKEELFNSEDLKKLYQVGLLSNDNENQFLQSLHNEKTISALSHTINSCLYKASEVIKYRLDNDEYMSNLYLIPFYATRMEVSMHYRGDIKVREDIVKDGGNKSVFIDYDPATHTYFPLGNMLHVHTNSSWLVDYKKEELIQPADHILKHPDIPTLYRNVDVRAGSSHRGEKYSLPNDVNIEPAYIGFAPSTIDVESLDIPLGESGII